jgi:Tol biopolymer transport system component
MDLDKVSKQLLFVEKEPQGYVLQNVNLNTLVRSVVEEREQEYWGLKWHESGKSFWLGNESLRLMSLDGESEIVHLPLGFIPDIDVNPVTKQLAHAEGLVNVNLYTMTLSEVTGGQLVNIQQLSSSARTDILPTLSEDGRQIAFISYQRRSMDGFKHVEVWLKNRDKKTANLLANLPETIQPQYLLWSPNGENLLLGDSRNNVYLINTFSRHFVPIISGYQAVDKVNWSNDGKFILFNAVNGSVVQKWRYDLQLNSTELLNKDNLLADKTVETTPVLSVAEIKKINPSYANFRELIENFLTYNLANELPVDNLRPSLMLYRPHVINLGIYYVVKQGHQLKLYLYVFEDKKNIYIANIGNHEQGINLMLNISASADGKQLVFSKVEGFETDILLQKLEDKKKIKKTR